MWVGWGTPYRVPTDPTCAEMFDVGILIETLVLFETKMLSKKNSPPQPANTPNSLGKVHLDQRGAQIRKGNRIMRRPCTHHFRKSFAFLKHEFKELRDLAVDPRALEL
jgi:hypothetical protein